METNSEVYISKYEMYAGLHTNINILVLRCHGPFKTYWYHQCSLSLISSLLGRRWNLGIAQRFLENFEQAVEPHRCLGVPCRFPVGRRSILGQNWAKSRSFSARCPGSDRPVTHRFPSSLPTGRRLILKILHGGRPVIGGAPKYARCPAVRRPGSELIERSPLSDLGQKSKAARSKAADRFWTRRPVTDWSPSGDWAATGRWLLESLWPSGFDFWP